jgi:hypothetical protein
MGKNATKRLDKNRQEAQTYANSLAAERAKIVQALASIDAIIEELRKTWGVVPEERV